MATFGINVERVQGMAKSVMRTTFLKSAEVEQDWYHVDGSDQVLGRLSVKIANVLMGKHKPTYAPYLDTGDFVVVTNVGKLKITGSKLEQNEYARYSGYCGGYKTTPMSEVFEKRPERVLHASVRRMLPKNALGRRMLKKLKMYREDAHPHAAQQPKEWSF